MEIENSLDLILTNAPIYRATNEFEKMFNSLGLTESEFIELLNILKDDNYISYQLGEPNVPQFKNKVANISITLKGKFFIKNGGYVQKLYKDKELFYRQRFLEKATLLLAGATALGGIVAAIYYIHQLVCGC